MCFLGLFEKSLTGSLNDVILDLIWQKEENLKDLETKVFFFRKISSK